MHIRKSFVDLTESERDAYLAAFLKLKVTPAPESNLADPPEKQFSIYDQFIAIHTASVRVKSTLNNGNEHNLGHDNPGFLPWHRQYLLQLQKALTTIDPDVVLPYWDWTAADATFDKLFTDDFLGGVPSIKPSDPIPVSSGYFSSIAPANKPGWWPTDLQGWNLPNDLQLPPGPPHFPPGDSWGGKLHRRLGLDSKNSLPDKASIEFLLSLNTYKEFWVGLEVGITIPSTSRIPASYQGMHNDMHGWVGGHMSRPLISPFDPVFALNHAYVDYLWDQWQRAGHQGAKYYPTTSDWDGNGFPGEIPRGHLLYDELYPWVGNNASAYTASVTRVQRFLPDTTGQTSVRPIDLLETENLVVDSDFNYQYQPPLIRFSTVKNILDELVKGWESAHGRPPNLVMKHHSPMFGWQTRDQLRDGIVRSNYPLIEPDKIGNKRAEETNLITILRGNLGHMPRMPHNGPYLDNNKIDVIAKWIDQGCLDDTEPPQQL